jgi:hypothetical protein
MVASILASSSCSQMQSIDFEQVLVGFNGPGGTESNFYRDRDSLERSWVRRAVSDDEVDRLISKVNFGNRVVLAFSV